MAVQASEILERAQTLIQDNTGVRWPLPELAGWLNDAMREVALQKPSASSSSAVLDLVAGTRQTIPVGALMLLRIVRNLESASTDGNRIGKRAIRLINRDVLDTQHPDWHDESVVPPEIQVKHFIFDETDPTSFYVYPASDGTGKVEALISQSPTPVAATGLSLTDYAMDLPLPDIYGNAVLDYVLYRAYSKDASFAENMDRAGFHFSAFANSLGIKSAREQDQSASNAGFRVTRDRVGSPTNAGA